WQSDNSRQGRVRKRRIGERSGREYGLRASLGVRVAAVNLDERKIDFDPVGETGKPSRKARDTAARPAGKRRRKRGVMPVSKSLLYKPFAAGTAAPTMTMFFFVGAVVPTAILTSIKIIATTKLPPLL